MKITLIQIENFRLLKDFSIDLAKELSLVIGKNNTGKTSFIQILQKFLSANSNNFNFEDFHVDIQKDISQKIEDTDELSKENYEEPKIKLRITIERDSEDNIENLADAGLITDLDADNKLTVLYFQYRLTYENFIKIKDDFKTHHIESAIDFLKKYHKAYFKIEKKGGSMGDEEDYIEVEDVKLKKFINIQTISAKRDVLNEDSEDSKSNNALSKLSYKYYEPSKNSNAPHVIDLQKKLIDTDNILTQSYEEIFKNVTEDVKKFSYSGSKIFVKSNFQEISLLKENTSVVYDEKGCHLPEDHNGLGYMNLFAMIFKLHIIFDDFKKVHSDSRMADINLLFIEEPEAHTHPQMQYVFIKNINNFLSKNKESLNLQTVITTHSSHIVSQSDFSDIKYFLYRDDQVVVKNLSILEDKYGNHDEGKASFKFLKHYLTLHSAELFFSDKIIFIEGVTERILFPAMMKKLDDENKDVEGYSPLLSQKISIIEVGAHSKLFDKFLEFLEIKTLIITDLDSVKENGAGRKEQCKVLEGTDTSNSSIKHYLQRKSWNDLKSITNNERVVTIENTEIYIAYQSEEESYQARSFEDAFFSINLEFIKSKMSHFSSLQNVDVIDSTTPDYFEIAKNCINKKTDFSTDILFYSDQGFTNWKTPAYINNGLLWLMKK
jgi:putative ATP-dependent endonuclease of the OLD family